MFCYIKQINFIFSFASRAEQRKYEQRAQEMNFLCARKSINIPQFLQDSDLQYFHTFLHKKTK